MNRAGLQRLHVTESGLPSAGLHHHRRDSHRADEEQVDDQGQELFILPVLAAVPPPPTHPQTQTGAPAGGLRSRWDPCFQPFLLWNRHWNAVPVCSGSVFCWLLPLHHSPPSVGGISYSALPNYDVWAPGRGAVSYLQPEGRVKQTVTEERECVYGRVNDSDVRLTGKSSPTVLICTNQQLLWYLQLTGIWLIRSPRVFIKTVLDLNVKKKRRF